MTFEPLATTGPRSGTTSTIALREALQGGNLRKLEISRIDASNPYILAARISGKLKADPFSDAAKKPDGEAQSATGGEIDVILVPDIDMLSSQFFALRQQGSEDDDFNLRPDNVTFVLNALDALAGDDRFIEVRKRRREHRTLQRIEERIAAAKKDAGTERAAFLDKFKQAIAEEQVTLDAEVQKIRDNKELSSTEKGMRIRIAQEVVTKRLTATKERLERKQNSEFREIERQLDRSIRDVQGGERGLATMFAPVLPLLLGIIMFVNLRLKEKEGVPQSRLK